MCIRDSPKAILEALAALRAQVMGLTPDQLAQARQSIERVMLEFTPLIETILSFFHTMAQPDSYLNEEALYLHSEPMRQKIRKERLSCCLLYTSRCV